MRTRGLKIVNHKRRSMLDAMERPLPASVDLERYVLGAILIEPNRLEEVPLEADDFSCENHRRIWKAICDCANDGYQPDRATVMKRLEEQGELQSCGGISYLVSLEDGMPKGINLAGWVRKIRENANLRRIIYFGQSLMERAFLRDGTASDILTDAAERAGDLNRNGDRSLLTIANLPSIYDLNFEGIKYLETPVVPEGALIALTGDAESGKSTIATSWLRNIALTGRPCLILDRDNPWQVVRDRFVRLNVPRDAIKVFGGWLLETVPQPNSPLVLDFVKRSNPKPVVMVDSASSFIEGDENDAEAMLALMRGCRETTDAGATLMVLHNTGKGEHTRDYRGHSIFRDKIDQGFVVKNLETDRRLGKILLRCFKSRFGLTQNLLYRYNDGVCIRDDEWFEASRTGAEKLTSLLRENPGVNKRAFEMHAHGAGIGLDAARDFLREGIRNKQIRQEPGPGKSHRHFLEAN